MRTAVLGLGICYATAFRLGMPLCCQSANVRTPVTVSMAEDEVVATEAPQGDEPKRREAYYCNEEGCWVAETYFCDETGCWVEDTAAAPPPIKLPDGRAFSMKTGVESHSEEKARATSNRRPAAQGIFAPAVVVSKQLLGEKELNKLRGEVIAQHSKVISAFVDTSESAFGQIVLKQMFEAADKDSNGTLDREEVRAALHALGFKFIKDKQIDQIFSRADENGDEVIDFEEFVKVRERGACGVHEIRAVCYVSPLLEASCPMCLCHAPRAACRRAGADFLATHPLVWCALLTGRSRQRPCVPASLSLPNRMATTSASLLEQHG